MTLDSTHFAWTCDSWGLRWDPQHYQHHVEEIIVLFTHGSSHDWTTLVLSSGSGFLDFNPMITCILSLVPLLFPKPSLSLHHIYHQMEFRFHFNSSFPFHFKALQIISSHHTIYISNQYTYPTKAFQFSFTLLYQIIPILLKNPIISSGIISLINNTTLVCLIFHIKIHCPSFERIHKLY